MYNDPNNSSYASPAGATFEVYCKTGFEYSDIHLSFAPDISACADRCAEWNLVSDASAPRCYGATLDYGSFGPSGAAGGSECWLKAAAPLPGTPQNLIGTTTEVDGARLLGVPSPVRKQINYSLTS